MSRIVVLVVAVVFIGGFAFLTLSAIVDQGITFWGVASLFIVVFMGISIIGALREPPRQ